MSENRFEHVTRRELLVAGIGYAAAVMPVTSWAVTTLAAGMADGDVEITLGKEKMPGYWAMPKGNGPFPVIIVVQEIFGIHEYIKDVCRRLAKEGYLAIAPSLYSRLGDATKIAEIDKILADIVAKVNHPQVMKDLDGVLSWLSVNPKADTKRVGITGFCWGGNITWMYAAHNPKLKAGVAWYGKVSGDKKPDQPLFPLDIANDLRVPVLGLYGEKDTGIPLDQVEKMKVALKKGKRTSEIAVFPGAGHGFHADYRPSYNAEAAKQGWEKLLAWFHKNGL